MHWRKSRLARTCGIVLLGTLLASGCTKLNAAFGDTEESAGAGVTSVDPTPGTAASMSGGGSVGDGPGTTGHGTTSVGDGDATTVDPSGPPATDADTGAKFDLGARGCAVTPGQECNAYSSDCPKGQSCKVFIPDGFGRPFETRCFDDGEALPLTACGPVCAGNSEFTCQAFHVCDQFSAVNDENGVCRPYCSGNVAAPSCADGLCFQYSSPLGAQLGVCRGDCNPTSKGVQCEQGMECVLRQDAPTPTCLPSPSVGASDDCSETECAEGSICIAAANLQACDSSWCCAEICDPPEGMCAGGGPCIPLEDIGGPVVDIGYCNPT